MASISRVSNLLNQVSKIRVPELPERIRNGKLKSFFDFFVNSYMDYTSVGKEIIQDARNRPLKACAIGSGLFTLYIAFKTNPNETIFHDQLVTTYVEMGLVDSIVRNPSSYDHAHELTRCENERILKRINLAFFSLMFEKPVNDNCSIYAARCSYLKPSYLDYIRNRVLDIGCFNTWWILKYKTVDYDINPEEWASVEKKT